MTCYFDPNGSTMDVYDHEGNLVAEDYPIEGHWDPQRGFPTEVLDVLYDAREGSQPSAYNQELLFCIAAEQIELGTPP